MFLWRLLQNKIMKKQVIITGWQSRVLTALYENDLLYELWMESEDNQVRVGDVYIGKVKHIVPNIQAAFVEITPGVMGYYSLKENTEHLFVNPKKNDKVVAGDEIVVQIEKENLKTKAWNLSGKISFTGRYMILNAGRKGVQLSAKIKDEAQRESLSSIVTNSAYNDKGWLIRTEAKDVPVGTILEEMERLIVNYNKLMSTAKEQNMFYEAAFRRYFLFADSAPGNQE